MPDPSRFLDFSQVEEKDPFETEESYVLRPYYEDREHDIEIYCGDCRKILPALPKTYCSTCKVKLADDSILAIHLAAQHEIRPYFDCCFTDPPYGVDYDGGTVTREKLAGDASASLYGQTLPMLARMLAPDAALYLFYADGDSAVLSAVLSAGFEIRNNLIWNKNVAQFGALSAQYKNKHEPFLYCYLKGERPRWFGPTNETTVWDCDRSMNGNLFHPTQKPTALIKRALRNSTKEGDRIIDPFMGAGSTLVAAREMRRGCIGIELEEKYAEIAATRLSQAMLQFE